jgi:hypothetical protein
MHFICFFSSSFYTLVYIEEKVVLKNYLNVYFGFVVLVDDPYITNWDDIWDTQYSINCYMN